MVNKGVLANAKKGVTIVNTARGELIDEDALVEATERGVVTAYTADVVKNEPIGSDHRLLKYPNIIITPHIVAYLYEALAGMDLLL